MRRKEINSNAGSGWASGADDTSSVHLSTSIPPGEKILRKFKHGSFGDLFFSVGLGAGLVFGARYLREAAAELPWFAWIVAGPMVFLVGLLILLIISAAFGSFLAGLKRTNWTVQISSRGVYLNLRSYRNAHFEGDDPTVVFFPFGEIVSVRKVRERSSRETSDGTTMTLATYVELDVTPVDTTALAEAARRERAREAPETSFLGIRSRTKHNHVTVFVPSPGRVRVESFLGLVGALGEHTRRLETRSIDLNAEQNELSLEERALQFAERGKVFEARALAKSELGLEKDEARAWLDSLTRESA